MAKNILITGASGFIGSFLVQEALKRNYNVWAGIRPSSSKEYLTDGRIHFLELDFAHPAKLQTQLLEHTFDYIIHCAGITKTNHPANFDKVNYLQTKCFVDTLMELNKTPKQFVYVSTLSIFGPIHEKDYAPIKETDTPAPNTAYGVSKLKAELYIQSIPNFPYVIYRPTGVYGPREKDYFLMAKAIKSHFDFSVGYKRQDITFIYVDDLVKVVFRGIERNIYRRAYSVADGNVYQSSSFSRLIKKELGNPFVFHIKCPLFILKAISLLAQFYAYLSGNSSTLNADKYKIIKQRNWRCDISPLINELDFIPQYDLEAGVKETIAWYKKEGWL
jgi:Nucleoside-diphosphate-sugar epimerases